MIQAIIRAFTPKFNRDRRRRRRSTSDRIDIENRLTRVEVLLVLDIAMGSVFKGLL